MSANTDSLFSLTLDLIKESLKKDHYYNSNIIEKNIFRFSYEDQKELYEWLIKHSDNGHIMKLIGNFFDAGLGYLKIDYIEALKWYLKAAEKNNSYAMVIIGGYYRKGKGIPIDYKECLNWYLKAADLGDSNAMNNIGLIYKLGIGVDIDFKTAVGWFSRAIKHGSTDAIFNLGEIYDKDGNYQEALKCFTIGYYKYDNLKKKATCKKKIEEIMKNTDILVLEDWIRLRDENQLLKDEIEELNTELKYRPDGEGYELAKHEFESLAKII